MCKGSCHRHIEIKYTIICVSIGKVLISAFNDAVVKTKSKLKTAGD